MSLASFEECRAVILAGGKGNKMKDLCDALPKFLLPVANKPVIFYPLCACLEAGFGSIIVVVSDKDVRKLKEVLKLYFNNIDSSDVKYCVINPEEDMGTLEVLLENKELLADNKTWRDLFVISCDSIIDFDPQSLFDVHRLNRSPLSAVFAKPVLKFSELNKVGAKSKSKKKFNDVIGLDTTLRRICIYQSEEGIQDGLALRNLNIPKFHLFTNLIDPHVYILSRGLLEMIENDEKLRENLTRIKSELMPYLAKKTDLTEHCSINSDDCADGGDVIYSMGKFKPCHFLMLNSDDFAWRADSVATFYEANRRVLDILTSKSAKSSFRNTASEKLFACHTSSSVMGTNLVGANNTFKDANRQLQENLIRNVIGHDCAIGKGSKLTGCVLFNNVAVGDNCKLENCILANQTSVGDGCELNNVLISSGQVVKSKSKLSYETVKKIVQFQ